MKTMNKFFQSITASIVLIMMILSGGSPVFGQEPKKQGIQEGKNNPQTEKSIDRTPNQRDMGQAQTGMMSKEEVNKMIQGWPSESQEVAKKMITKYGQPTGSSQSMLVWTDNGPWKKTIVYKDGIDHNFPMKHKDVIEQVIDYKVPAELFSQLAMYDGSIVAKRTNGELCSRNDKEESNLLALNIANDIITGKKNVEEARQFYTETMSAFVNGQKPDYTQKLMFAIQKGNTADPDEPTMDMMDKMKNMMKGSE